MAFGLLPKYQQEEIIEGLNQEQIIALSVDAIKALDWKLSNTSSTGLIGFTRVSWISWSEEITIKTENSKLIIKSQCTSSQLIDYGKNKKNVLRFVNKFKYLQGNTSLEQLDEKYNDLKISNISNEDYSINQTPKSSKDKISNIFSIFIPKDDYYITPIIIDLNIIVFILMLINGAGFVLPDNQILLVWGANFKPFTLDGGQWWRLFTGTFIHAGFFHLLMNMYALLYIGLLLEPYLGKVRFAILYVLTGLLASTTSLCWHDFNVCVGASGAIFGLYGVFLAMLTTNLIEKSARRAFLTSIGVFVFYNLINGMKGNIDNAAHIGGLISGILLGYGAYFSLREKDEFEQDMKMIKNLAFSIIIAILTIIIVFNVLDKNYTLYANRMDNFKRTEINALAIYRSPKNVDTAVLGNILNDGLTKWHDCYLIIDSLDKMDLPINIRVRNSKLKKYIDLRIEAYMIIKNGLKKDSLDKNLLDLKNGEIEKALNELKNN